MRMMILEMRTTIRISKNPIRIQTIVTAMLEIARPGGIRSSSVHGQKWWSRPSWRFPDFRGLVLRV